MSRFVTALGLVLSLSFPALAVNRTWTGAINANWSEPDNWSPSGTPGSSDLLIFNNVPLRVLNNDLPAGTAVGPMVFTSDYVFNGNRLTLTGNMVFQPQPSSFVCNLDLTIGATVSIGGGYTTSYNGAIDVNGHDLSIGAPSLVINGPLNGSGSFNGGYVRLTNSGNFSGSMTGTFDIEGSLPNANITAENLSGDGTVGTVAVDQMTIGQQTPGGIDPHTIGTLRTKSITFRNGVGPNLSIDLVPGGTSDKLIVTGSVTILGASPVYPNVIGTPTVGQTFTLIDNDGNDPVAGTFSNAPEGGSLNIGSTVYTITYHGGDGNDVVLTAASQKKTWTGAVSANWSDPQNWSPQALPVAGEDLVFPGGASHRDMNNDLPPGFTAGTMVFSADYTLSGNRLVLTGKMAHSASFTCNADLTLGQSVEITGVTFHTYNGSVNLNGHTLSLGGAIFNGPVNGNGAIVGGGLGILNGGTFTGTITASYVEIKGSLPNATVHGSTVSGDGTLGNITADQVIVGPAFAYTNPHEVGTLRIGSLAMSGYIGTSLDFDLVPGGTSDLLKVTGSVSIDNSSLHLNVTSTPTLGQQFLLVDNDGTDPVIGRFVGAAEGGRYDAGADRFRVTYVGGDGNDVVLTSASDTSATLIASPASTTYGEPVTFTATVSSPFGTPTGSVTFMDGATSLGTAALQAGSAQLTTSALHGGSRSVTAVYGGVLTFFASTSNAVSHNVQKGATTTAITPDKSSITYGDSLMLTVNVAPVASADSGPSGTATVHIDNNVANSGTVANGIASIPISGLHAGTHSIFVSYDGSGDFLTSDSSPISINVARAATSVTATADNNPVPIGKAVALTIRLAPISATGTVVITKDGNELVRQAITGSTTVKLTHLPIGRNDLLIAFTGNDDFRSSSITFTETVLLPAIAADDLVVSEGNEGTKTIQIAVSMSATSTDVARVSWSTADGTAIAGRDYHAASGVIEFQPGETEHAIPIVIDGNTTPEDDKLFSIVLSNPVNAVLDHPSATIVITDDDTARKKLGEFTYVDTPNGPLTLDLYTPPAGDGRRPLVIWIPGLTSYNGGSGTSSVLRQTLRGYLVAVVRYRDPAVARFPAQLTDLQAAVRWLRANADQYGINPDRIAAWGDGTGAHLAALLGTHSDPASKVQAVIDWNGATDLGSLNADAANSCVDHDDVASPESELIGCPLPACIDTAKSASPLTFASVGSSSFLIMHGGANCSVASMQSRKLHDALRQAGADSMLYILDGVTLIDPFWSGLTATAAVDEFLDTHLKGAPVRHRPAR